MAATEAAGRKVPRRRAATREQLLASADACFLERGYHGSTVGWLAAQAGYTDGAIYSSFGDKASLFLAVLERRTEAQLEQWREAATAPDAQATVSTMLAQMLDDSDYLRWFSAYLEFFSVAVRDPDLRSAVSVYLTNLTHTFEAVIEPLTHDSSIAAADFARLVIATANGLGLFVVAEETTSQSELMATLLSRLRDTPAR